MRRLLVVLALLALARPAAAHIIGPTLTPLALTRLAVAATTEPPAPANMVRVVNYTMANGQTVAIRLFADTPEQRRRIESVADRLEAVMQQRAEQQKDGYIDEAEPDWSAYSGGEFGGQTVTFRAEEAVAFACALVSGAAQRLGYMNIWLDATNALCLSFTIVDLGERLFDYVYAGYIAKFRSPRPKIPMIMWGLYSIGGLPIY